MGWKEQYLPASFGSVPFYAKVSSVKGGRRLVTHMYPQSDTVEHEDLGADDTKFSFNAYIVGDDYFSARDKLETEFRKNTVGRLVHPFRNAINVRVESYALTEEADRGGVVFFNVTFVLDPEPALAVVADTKKQVELVSAELDVAVADWFEAVYDIDNISFGILDDILDTLDSVLGVLDNVKKAAATAAAFKRQISNIRGKLISLRVNAGAIAFTMKGVVDFAVDTADDLGNLFSAKDQSREQKQIYDSTKTPYTSNVTSDVAENSSYPSKQIRNLVAYNTVASTMKLMTKINFKSSKDIADEQKILFASIDELSNDSSIDDTIFSVLRKARAVVYKYLSEEVEELPSIITITPQRSRNTLELANDFYGNISEEQILIDLNGIIHPGFIPKHVEFYLRTRV